MTKKELLELPAFQRASDDAVIWITGDCDEVIPYDGWLLKFADGLQHLILNARIPEDPWQPHRLAAKTLNAQNLGIKFYGNLFPYLRRKGALKGYCKLGKRGKQKVWLYDTEGIAMLVKSGELNYKPQ